MNYRINCTYQACILLLLTFNTSIASAKEFAERFRDFILDSAYVTSTQAAQQQDLKPIRSHECMACHDGSGGQRVALKHAESPMRFSGNHNVDHPVGMDYASYAYRDPVVYVLPQQLDERILLEDGKVTCLSCHETKTREQVEQDYLIEVRHARDAGDDQQVCTATDRLTTGTHQTALCLACHAM